VHASTLIKRSALRARAMTFAQEDSRPSGFPAVVRWVCGVSASEPNPFTEEKPMTLGTILLIILVLMLFGAIPRWPHSRNWGYGPSGGLGLVLVVVVVLLLMGRL
jgi:Protein of unknown function (DUF3309)